MMIVFWVCVVGLAFLWVGYFRLDAMSKHMDIPYHKEFSQATLVGLLIATASVILVAFLEFAR